MARNGSLFIEKRSLKKCRGPPGRKVSGPEFLRTPTVKVRGKGG